MPTRCVHIEDRGYQFADGVYEVCEIWNGHLIDETRHLDRLERSLRELAIAHADDARWPCSWCCARWCGATASRTVSSTCR